MKKILGLDLGVTSIGWALIKEENDKPAKIMGMGVRIIPLEKDDSDEFTKGNAISKNRERTQKRTSRKSYYRYVLRRKALTKELKKHEMFDETLFNLPQLELWELRSKAVTEQITLEQLGRVLYHLNQKRGYKSTRIEQNDKGANPKEYVANINNRYEQLKQEGKTIGQKFYEELCKNQYYRTKDQVFPREAYMEEYDKIMQKQKEFYPDVLTDELIRHIKEDIIYYQRPLKSQKGLVSICQFEGFHCKNQDGKEIFTGPKVAHRSNPIFQVEKIWETINNIVIKNKRNEEFPITLDQKKKIFEYLDNNEKLTQSKLFEILGIKEKSGWYGNKMISKGLQGNITKMLIKNALNDKNLEQQWLKFDLKVKILGEKVNLVNKDTGEIRYETDKKIICKDLVKDLVNEPLYQLWHTIYSINNIEECKNALKKKFNFDDNTAERLAKIDFARLGYGNKSVKAIRKILPYLMEGLKYSDAKELAGYKKDENISRQLLNKLRLLKKNELRQPVVEKILNQMIHIVNDIIDENRGWVTKEEREEGSFEIRIELARELKQTKEERNATFKRINQIEKENEKIEQHLREMGLRTTRNNIIKYRLFNEIAEGEGKLNAMCIYTGKMFSLTDALTGDNIDVEHIIPQSLIFDDSQSNKTLTFRWVNQEKGNRTAYDYMASKGEEELNKYIERVDSLYRKGIISRKKRDYLLMPANKIPKDFIDRQLRESQYISRKAREILTQVAKNVWTTGGGVTEYLRRIWGWDDVLMNLHIKRIKEIINNPVEQGVIEVVEIEKDGQKHKKEIIKDWTKRNDHRHHAIDALVIACTKQGYIQRINTLSAQTTRDELYKEVSERKEEFRESLDLLDKYFILQRPFTTAQLEDVVSKIIVSYKPGKKVATNAKRFIQKGKKRLIAQRNILVPRGALCEESLYGKIKIIEKNKPVEYLFKNPHLIVKPHIKQLVEERLASCNNDVKKALNSLKNNPIYLPNKNEPTELTFGSCFKEEYVIKYNIQELKPKDIDYIIDKKVREIIKQRLEQFNNNTKEAFKDTLYFDKDKKIPIRSVRMITGLTAVEPVRKDKNGNPIAFVKPANNHHIAIYQDENGKKEIHLCTFWHAVERKKYQLPIIIKNPGEVWDTILSKPDAYPQHFLQKLPKDNWTFVESFQQNEIFYISPNDNDDDKMNTFNFYRVQKLSCSGKQLDIFFRQIYESILDDSENAKKILKFYRVLRISRLEELKVKKVKVNRLGEIVK